MDNEIELISDGDGMAIIGKPAAVERFLRSVEQWKTSRRFDLGRLKPLFEQGANTTKAASEITANSGRWIKLTEESARRVKADKLMPSKEKGVSHLMIGKPGDIQSWLQTEQNFGSLLTNPAVLSGVAGIMAQVAAQQTMAEITEYLVTIDEKVDDVLRRQDDAHVGQMIGVGLSIDSAMTVREATGGVSEVTWSKVQAASDAIGHTQGYAMLRLDALAEKLQKKNGVGGIAKAVQQAQSEIQQWLAVLARCVQLLMAMDVLELDRVLQLTPEKLEDHRRGLRAARYERLQLISQHTQDLLNRLDLNVGLANAKMLQNLTKSQAVVESSNHLATLLDDFHSLIGIEADPHSWEPRQLPPVAQKGAQAIQVAKDKGPAAVGAVGIIAVGALKLRKSG